MLELYEGQAHLVLGYSSWGEYYEAEFGQSGRTGYRLLEAEIDKANAELARVEHVRAFRVLPSELDPEREGEPVTPTRKVKRRLMLERYHDLVESMFASDEEVAALTKES